jgi:hypothetical protein
MRKRLTHRGSAPDHADGTMRPRPQTLKRLLIGTIVVLALVAVSGIVGTTAPASAGVIVDPSALQPPPPPGALCRADGRYVICHTFLDFTLVNEPVFDLPCGTVYETSFDHREGIRWYADGLLVKRFVTQDVEGTWSLSPTGAGPTVRLMAHANWWTDYAVAGDESTQSITFHGDSIRVQLPGSGGTLHIAGLDRPDNTHEGVIRFIDDPGAAAAICASLAP